MPPRPLRGTIVPMTAEEASPLRGCCLRRHIFRVPQSARRPDLGDTGHMATASEPGPFSSLHKKMQLKPGTQLWVWPEAATAPELADTQDLVRAGLDEANAAVLFVEGSADVEKIMADYRPRLSELKVVWLVYAKGNKAPVNRDTLWTRLLGHSWRAVSNVSYSDSLSAIRIRPLKTGEEVRQP